MKDFIFICIMCAVFVMFVFGLIALHIWWGKEQIEKAYKQGYEDGKKGV